MLFHWESAALVADVKCQA